MLLRYTPYRTLQHQRLIGSDQGVGAVKQVDLVLGGRALLDQRIYRQVLRGTSVTDIVHQLRHIGHGINAIGLACRQRSADAVALGMNRPA